MFCTTAAGAVFRTVSPQKCNKFGSQKSQANAFLYELSDKVEYYVVCSSDQMYYFI